MVQPCCLHRQAVGERCPCPCCRTEPSAASACVLHRPGIRRDRGHGPGPGAPAGSWGVNGEGGGRGGGYGRACGTLGGDVGIGRGRGERGLPREGGKMGLGERREPGRGWDSNPACGWDGMVGMGWGWWGDGVLGLWSGPPAPLLAHPHAGLRPHLPGRCGGGQPCACQRAMASELLRGQGDLGQPLPLPPILSTAAVPGPCARLSPLCQGCPRCARLSPVCQGCPRCRPVLVGTWHPGLLSPGLGAGVATGTGSTG